MIGSVEVSIIMGAYNIGRLPVFDRVMQSVLSQEMSDFEFIICDDGSTDDTWEKLLLWHSRDNRIRLIRNEQNMGLAATLNHCIEKSVATLIARQDADDISLQDRLIKQVAFLNQNPDIDFVGTQTVLYNEQGAWGYRQFPLYPQKEDFLFTVPFIHGSLVFRRQALILANNYCVSKQTRRTEDYDLLMRMYSLGLRGANLKEALYWFLENQEAQKRRKYCYRIDEAKVRLNGFSALGLMPRALPFVFKPLIVGLIPPKVLDLLKKSVGVQHVKKVI